MASFPSQPRLAWLIAACAAASVGMGCAGAQPRPAYETIGAVHRADSRLDALVPVDARIEKLAGGFTWSEGPLWIKEGSYLLFTDVPGNRIHRWSEADGVSVFLEPSGYDGPPNDALREPGANGLIRGPGNTILLADHGNRALARLDLSTKQKTYLVRNYQGKKFNSPNDLVVAKDGTIYFTDPPYGLQGLDKSPAKELSFSGVYRLAVDGTVTLVDDSMVFPNGIALSPDERTLYVANSDPKRAIWMAYRLDDGKVAERRVFADLTDRVGDANPGLPDGIAIDRSGNLFATGPGGVVVFAPDGTMLGTIATGGPVANCKFGEDGRTLFLTSGPTLARVRTATIGLGY